MSKTRDRDSELAVDMPHLKTPPMSPALAAEVRDAKPVKLRRPMHEFGLFLALSIPMFALLILLLGVRSDLSDLSPLWLGSVSLLWLASYSASAYLGFVPARGLVQPQSRSIHEVVAAASLVLVSVGLFASQGGVTPQSTSYPSTAANIIAYAPSCAMVGVGIGILPGLLALFLLRRYVPVGRLSIGLSLGAAGGSMSGLLLHLHCPVSERFHVGLVHGGCLVLSALFVAGASRVLLRYRSDSLRDSTPLS